MEKSDKFCLGDAKASSLIDSGAKSEKDVLSNSLYSSSGDLHHAVAGRIAPTQSSVDGCNPGFVSGHQSLASIHQGAGHGTQVG